MSILPFKPFNSVFPIWSAVRAETVAELCLKQHNCVITIMNCPRGPHSKRNLWLMRQFFFKFRKVNAVSSQLNLLDFD